MPTPFALFYQSSDIDTSHRYGLRAEIVVDNEIRWKNIIDYPVITQGAPDVAFVMMGMIDSSDRTPPDTPSTQALPEQVGAAVNTALREEIGDRPLLIGSYSRETWSDGCLG